MNSEQIENELRALFSALYSLDIKTQKLALQTYYDNACRLQNPYMILTTRDEIISLFESSANQNTELSCEITSISYDKVLQIAAVGLKSTINPKALGGLLPICIGQEIKLQLECTHSGDSNKKLSKLLYVTDHLETHFAQDYISRVPVLGSWYDTSIRETVGKLVITTGSIIDATGILNYVPSYVEKMISTAHSAKSIVGQAAEDAMVYGQSAVTSTSTRISSATTAAIAVGHQAVEAVGATAMVNSAGHVFESGLVVANTAYTGVSGAANSAVTSVSGVANSAATSVADSTYSVLQFARQTGYIVKLKAAEWTENVKETRIRCYSPTCQPGVKCYSPSCARNKPEGGFMLTDVVDATYKSYMLKK